MATALLACLAWMATSRFFDRHLTPLDGFQQRPSRTILRDESEPEAVEWQPSVYAHYSPGSAFLLVLAFSLRSQASHNLFLKPPDQAERPRREIRSSARTRRTVHRSSRYLKDVGHTRLEQAELSSFRRSGEI